MKQYNQTAQRNGRRYGFAQIIFSDALDYLENGERFSKYLLKQFPNSTLVKLEAKRSPSTGNDICTYIWNIPHASFKKHKFYPKSRART